MTLTRRATYVALPAALRPLHHAHLSARAPAAEESVGAIGLEAGHDEPSKEDRDTGIVGEIAASAGVDAATFTRELPGMSAFVLEDGVVYHTYSTYARGLDARRGAATSPASGCAGGTSTLPWRPRHVPSVRDGDEEIRCLNMF